MMYVWQVKTKTFQRYILITMLLARLVFKLRVHYFLMYEYIINNVELEQWI